MRNMIQVITIGSALLGVVGLARWIQQESRIDFARPWIPVRSELYRRIERAWKTLFRGSQDVRFTVFIPDPKDPETLRPMARVGWGRASTRSMARFRKNEGLAGIVWSKPEAGIAMANLGPFASDVEAREAQQKLLHLPRETAERLSSDQLRAQTVIAARLDCGGWFKGVLCIDCVTPSLIPGPEEGQRFWTEIARLAASIAPLVPFAGEPRIAVRGINSVNGAELKEVRLEAASV
jgi:hypothetical protein